MSILEVVYDRSPVFLQNVMASAKGYSNNRVRYGRAYKEHREFLRSYDSWTLDEKRVYQDSELRKFVRYAFNQSPFYRRLYRDVDIDSIRTTADMSSLPVVDKEMLRLNMDDVVTVSERESVEGHTGGTTGTALVVRFTHDDMMARMATLDHFKARVGFEHRVMRRASFTGKHIVPSLQPQGVYWRYNLACKQMLLSSFHLTEGNMGQYVRALNDFKPASIDGIFSAICDVASYIERHKVDLTFRPVAIFPTCETLTQHGRELLERVFECKVYDQYASSEGACFVAECENQRLHMDLSSGVIEHLDGSDEVLITSFTTHGTPLIRYRIGDRMVFDDGDECPCGDSSPVVASIEGRRLDFLYTAEGQKVSASLASILFSRTPNAIIRGQLVQSSMDHVTALLEVDPHLYRPEYDELMMAEFRYQFGERTTLTIEHVDEIPRERSGKLRFIRNLVGEGSVPS